MTMEEIKDLIDRIDQSKLTEFVYEREGEKLILSKKQKPAPQPVAIMPPAAFTGTPAEAFSGAMTQTASGGSTQASDAAENSHGPAGDDAVAEVRSPYVGTILLNADDSTAALVYVGDRVKKGQKLCQIEAMKMYNDVVSPTEGKIVSIEVDHGDIVECDQLLFKIEKG